MKKLLILSFVIAVTAGACKRKQACPAYGKTLNKIEASKVKA